MANHVDHSFRNLKKPIVIKKKLVIFLARGNRTGMTVIRPITSPTIPPPFVMSLFRRSAKEVTARVVSHTGSEAKVRADAEGVGYALGRALSAMPTGDLLCEYIASPPPAPVWATIPDDILRVTTLTTLTLPRVGLTELGAEIGKLAMLERLVLPHNKLIVIPPELGKLFALRHLGACLAWGCKKEAGMARVTPGLPGPGAGALIGGHVPV